MVPETNEFQAFDPQGKGRVNIFLRATRLEKVSIEHPDTSQLLRTKKEKKKRKKKCKIYPRKEQLKKRQILSSQTPEKKKTKDFVCMCVCMQEEKKNDRDRINVLKTTSAVNRNALYRTSHKEDLGKNSIFLLRSLNH